VAVWLETKRLADRYLDMSGRWEKPDGLYAYAIETVVGVVILIAIIVTALTVF
jgi:hypothetical protein